MSDVANYDKAIKFFEERDRVVSDVLVNLYLKSDNRRADCPGIRQIIHGALGNGKIYKGKRVDHPVRNMIYAVGDLEKENDYDVMAITRPFQPRPIYPSVDEICEELIDPINSALMKKTGVSLGARDIAEQIPHQGVLPEWWTKEGWDATDAHPYRRSSLDGGEEVRFYAYPFMRRLLEVNQEWFTAEQLLQKCVIEQFPFKPHKTFLQIILMEGADYYTRMGYKGVYRTLRPTTKFFGDDPLALVKGYLAHDLWPSHQNSDREKIRNTIQEWRADTGTKTGDRFFDAVLDLMEKPERPDPAGPYIDTGARAVHG